MVLKTIYSKLSLWLENKYLIASLAYILSNQGKMAENSKIIKRGLQQQPKVASAAPASASQQPSEELCSQLYKFEEPWYKRSWRPAAAIIYLVVCVFDFLIMPSIIEHYNQKIDIPALIEVTKDIKDPTTKAQVITKMIDHQTRKWRPVTLGEAGTFHIAFGAILGAAAWTRGREKEARIKNGFVE